MRRLLPFLLLLAGVTLVLIAEADDSEANGGSPCASARSTTVHRTSYGRFFRKRRASRFVPGRTYVSYHACAYRYDRRFVLAESGFEGEDVYGPYALRGPFGAYGWRPSCGACEYSEARVMVQDLRTGRHRRSLPSLGEEPQDGDSERVTDLALKGNSAVAWIATRSRHSPPGGGEPERTTVVRFADRGGVRQLDEGTGIAPTSLSLRISDSRVSWRKDGETRSALLR